MLPVRQTSTPKRLVVPENGFATNCKTIIYASGKFVAAGLRNVDDFDPYSSIAISNEGITGHLPLNLAAPVISTRIMV